MNHGNTRFRLRYLVLRSDSDTLLTWSYDFGRAVACMHGLKKRLIACHLEVRVS